MTFQVTGTKAGRTGEVPFCAGLAVRQDGVVTATAPFLYHLFNRQTLDYVMSHCRMHGWTIEPVNDAAREYLKNKITPTN
jgi:hypothetical protein